MSRPAMRAVMLSALVPTLGLAACASAPDARLPTPTTVQTLASAESFKAPQGQWPGDGWWRAYGDAQLNSLIDAALANSPDMAAAAARLEKARAQTSAARAAELPSLQGQAEIIADKQSYNTGIPPAFAPKGYKGFGQLSLNFDWELDFWGKNRAAVAAAASDARAAEADRAEARLVLSTAIASTYADYARLWAERDVAQRAVQSRQETLQLVNQRVESGLDTRGELAQAQAGPAAARADLAAIDEDIDLSRNALAALMGAGPDSGLAMARPAKPSLRAFGLPANLAANLIGRRPDIVAARWRAEAAQSRIGVARAQFYPNINLAALIGYQSLGLSKLFASGSGIGQFGPAISLPIFEGGRLRANLKGARADYALAVASYDQVLIQALRQTADAAASERALAGRLRESAAALAADEDAYRIARLRYEGGLSNYQSVLLAEDAVLQARRIVVDLQARAFTLDVQLVRALGGGYQA